MGLNNAAGGAQVVVYDVNGQEMHRQAVQGVLSSGRYYATVSYAAPAGQDVGSFKVVSATGSITMDSFTQTQALHVADTRTHIIYEALDSYYGGAGDDVIRLIRSAEGYLASTANKGIHGGDGVDTLKLIAYNHVMNLNLATSAGKLTGVEVIDITGTGNNTLTLSLQDVLANGQTDIFHVGSKQTVQMMVKGNAGDIVNLDDLLGPNGVDVGDWVTSGMKVVGGLSYIAYQHSGLEAELLVQDAVKVNLV